MLTTTEYGAHDDVPLLIVHGLFGSGRNWGVIAKWLAADRKVVTVDMRNHAGSFWAADHSYPTLAQDLADVMQSYGTMDVIGHSMGGKAAMVAALAGAPIRKLVVADIAPVGYSHTQMPMIEAMRALDLSSFKTRTEADTALSAYVPEKSVRAFLLQSLDVQGQKWRLNLDALADQMDLIIGFPEVSGTFNNDTLFLSGAASDYVTRDFRPRIKDLFPTARFAKIPDAGHWLHAEKPKEFTAAARAFLSM